MLYDLAIADMDGAVDDIEIAFRRFGGVDIVLCVGGAMQACGQQQSEEYVG
jgi:hypothetical protein